MAIYDDIDRAIKKAETEIEEAEKGVTFLKLAGEDTTEPSLGIVRIREKIRKYRDALRQVRGY